MIDDTITNPISNHTRIPSVPPDCTASMTWPTSSGCTSEVAAPKTLSTATTTSVRLCSKRKGSSWRKVARGPSCCAPRPRRRSVAVRDMRDLVLEKRGTTTVLRAEGVGDRSGAPEAPVRGLLRDSEGAGDGLPRVAGEARAAHLRLFGPREFAAQP